MHDIKITEIKRILCPVLENTQLFKKNEPQLQMVV